MWVCVHAEVVKTHKQCVSCFLFQVHLCEIESPQDLPNLEFSFNVRKGRPLLVAVKILRPDASKNARSAFTFSLPALSTPSSTHGITTQLLSSFSMNHPLKFPFLYHPSLPPSQERFSEGGEDPVSSERPQHHPSAWRVREQ